MDSKDLSGFLDMNSRRLTSPAKSRRKQLSLDKNSKDLSGFDHSATSPQFRKKEISFVDSKDLSGFDTSSQPTTSRRSESRQASRVEDGKDLSGFDVDSQLAASQLSVSNQEPQGEMRESSGLDHHREKRCRPD